MVVGLAKLDLQCESLKLCIAGRQECVWKRLVCLWAPLSCFFLAGCGNYAAPLRAQESRRDSLARLARQVAGAARRMEWIDLQQPRHVPRHGL